MRHIDPHVHCRDGKEEYKTNIRKVSEAAEKQEIVAILDMARVFTEKQAQERIALAKMRQPSIAYFFYARLTTDQNQIAEAVKVVNNYPPAVGLKLRAVDVPREKDLKRVYRTLVKLNYTGLLAVHCQKASRFKPELWNPWQPWTHYLVQPPAAEIESVAEQINFAKMSQFPGHLHICHISCHKSVNLVCKARKKLRISCGITPHHLKWSSEKMKEPGGLFYKCDPPLAIEAEVLLLREDLKNGKIDWIETDFAPHTLQEKLKPPYLSGIADYSLYSDVLEWLRQQGIKEETIENLTYGNIKKVFGQKLEGV